MAPFTPRCVVLLVLLLCVALAIHPTGSWHPSHWLLASILLALLALAEESEDEQQLDGLGAALRARYHNIRWGPPHHLGCPTS